MATKLKLAQNDSCREKIQVTQLLHRLQDSVIGPEAKELTTNQIAAIKILLSKTLPDLSSVQHNAGEGSGEFTIKWES